MVLHGFTRDCWCFYMVLLGIAGVFGFWGFEWAEAKLGEQKALEVR